MSLNKVKLHTKYWQLRGKHDVLMRILQRPFGQNQLRSVVNHRLCNVRLASNVFVCVAVAYN